jgi:KUP system potassium uptake protein
MLVWFVATGVLGMVGIARTPAVLAALSPLPAITYLWQAGPIAFVVIGAAFLAVTGGRGVLCRYGSFRAVADPRCLVRRGVACIDA